MGIGFYEVLLLHLLTEPLNFLLHPLNSMDDIGWKLKPAFSPSNKHHLVMVYSSFCVLLISIANILL